MVETENNSETKTEEQSETDTAPISIDMNDKFVNEQDSVNYSKKLY